MFTQITTERHQVRRPPLFLTYTPMSALSKYVNAQDQESAITFILSRIGRTFAANFWRQLLAPTSGVHFWPRLLAAGMGAMVIVSSCSKPLSLTVVANRCGQHKLSQTSLDRF